MFTRLAPKGEPIGAERLNCRHPAPSRGDALYLLIPVLATIALVATLVVGLATSRATACRPAVYAGRSSVLICSGRPLRPAGP
jgi:hypothetical protein